MALPEEPRYAWARLSTFQMRDGQNIRMSVGPDRSNRKCIVLGSYPIMKDNICIGRAPLLATTTQRIHGGHSDAASCYQLYLVVLSGGNMQIGSGKIQWEYFYSEVQRFLEAQCSITKDNYKSELLRSDTDIAVALREFLRSAWREEGRRPPFPDEVERTSPKRASRARSPSNYTYKPASQSKSASKANTGDKLSKPPFERRSGLRKRKTINYSACAGVAQDDAMEVDHPFDDNAFSRSQSLDSETLYANDAENLGAASDGSWPQVPTLCISWLTSVADSSSLKKDTANDLAALCGAAVHVFGFEWLKDPAYNMVDKFSGFD